MIKISATQLESYRRFIDGLITVEQFERSLLRLDPPNAMMQRGIDFHTMMQTDNPELFKGVFSENCITQARSKMDYRSKIFECRAKKIYKTKYGDILVSGMADQLLGYDIVEIKTRYSPINYDSYAQSMQWRVYCELFGAKYATYKVFEFKDANSVDFKNYAEYTFAKPMYNESIVFDMIHYLHEYIVIRGLSDKRVLQTKESQRIENEQFKF
jgi:hypothetical protein